MSDPNFYFESERLRMSYWLASSDEHCEFLVKLFNQPLFIEGEGKTGIDTVEKARTRLERFAEEHARNGYGSFLVSLKESGTPIGTVSLMRGKDSVITLPDVGFAIVEEENGKGYATEAGRAVIDWVKRERGVEGVFGFCDPNNTRSRRAMEKVGLEFRGLRTLYQFGGIEGCCYALPEMKDPKEYGVGISPAVKSA